MRWVLQLCVAALVAVAHHEARDFHATQPLRIASELPSSSQVGSSSGPLNADTARSPPPRTRLHRPLLVGRPAAIEIRSRQTPPLHHQTEPLSRERRTRRGLFAATSRRAGLLRRTLAHEDLGPDNDDRTPLPPRLGITPRLLRPPEDDTRTGNSRPAAPRTWRPSCQLAVKDETERSPPISGRTSR